MHIRSETQQMFTKITFVQVKNVEMCEIGFCFFVSHTFESLVRKYAGAHGKSPPPPLTSNPMCSARLDSAIKELVLLIYKT